MTRIRTWIGVAAVFAAATAQATNGYFPHGYGTRAKGMAGATTAVPLDAMIVASNPANLIGAGDRVDVGLALFNPERAYRVSGDPSAEGGLEPGRQESESVVFGVPSIALSRKTNDATAWGLAIFRHGGMATEYPAHANPVRDADGQCPSGTFCSGAAGVDLEQWFVMPSLARAFRGDWAWGVAPILAYQRFSATGLAAFGDASTDAQSLSDNGRDEAWGYGLRLGIAGAINDRLQVGLSWQSRVRMQEFGRYAGLFAQQGRLDVPASVNAGLAWIAGDRTVVALDVQRTLYSDIPALANPLPADRADYRLGDDSGGGLGWDDVTVVKLGLERTLSAHWAMRLGYSRGNRPIDGDDVLFGVLAPALVTTHVTAGVSWRKDIHHEFSLALMYAPEQTVTGPNPLDPDQSIELQMDQRELEFGYSYWF